MIPYARPLIPVKDLKKINILLKKKFLTQGPLVKKFEDKIKNYCNARYAVSVNSASSGLHIACIAIGIKKNDIVWTSPNTFAATANAVMHCGGKIDFVDIDKEHYNICINSLKKKLIIAKRKKKIPKAIIVVHFSGNPCDMVEIKKLSKKYSFKIIEDASHALGATYRGNKIGNCKFSDMAVFSFHPVKIITTAEGGMVTTNIKKYADLMKMLRTNGITRSDLKNKNRMNWYYEQKILGFNYRMNEIQAAIGLTQLKNLNKWLTNRDNIRKVYNKNLKKLSILLPKVLDRCLSSNHLYVVQIKKNKTINRDLIFNYLRKKNIETNVHYIPLYKHPYYKNINIEKKFLKNCENYYEQALSLPMYPGLKKKDQFYIIKKLKSFFNNV